MSCTNSKFSDFASPVTLPGASLWHFCQKPSWHESGFLIQPGVAPAFRNSLPDYRSLNQDSLSPELEEEECEALERVGTILGVRLVHPKKGRVAGPAATQSPTATRSSTAHQAQSSLPQPEDSSEDGRLFNLWLKHIIKTKEENSLKRRGGAEFKRNNKNHDQVFPCLFFLPHFSSSLGSTDRIIPRSFHHGTSLSSTFH